MVATCGHLHWRIDTQRFSALRTVSRLWLQWSFGQDVTSLGSFQHYNYDINTTSTTNLKHHPTENHQRHIMSQWSPQSSSSQRWHWQEWSMLVIHSEKPSKFSGWSLGVRPLLGLITLIHWITWDILGLISYCGFWCAEPMLIVWFLCSETRCLWVSGRHLSSSRMSQAGELTKDREIYNSYNNMIE